MSYRHQHHRRGFWAKHRTLRGIGRNTKKVARAGYMVTKFFGGAAKMFIREGLRAARGKH